ncbi:MAG: hypothetical protein GW938_08935 [Leptospira sp.]|nr:hypothetical protein [Leptospira sp.]NCS92656.1 hypothetical protein [Leptospira sp.]
MKLGRRKKDTISGVRSFTISNNAKDPMYFALESLGIGYNVDKGIEDYLSDYFFLDRGNRSNSNHLGLASNLKYGLIPC